MNYITFIIIQLITRITSILGTLIFMSGTIIPYQGWGLVIIIGSFILGIIGFILSYKYSDKINNLLEKLSEKVTNMLKHHKENK